MKRNIAFVIALMSLSQTVKSQFDAKFGQVSQPELDMKECAFDPEANAVVLFDEASSNYNDQHNLLTNRHTRIKILKEKGIEYANIVIPYYSEDDFEFVRDIQATIINVDQAGVQTSVNVDRKSIFYQKRTSKYSEVRFTFPGVKVGSIIEYSYWSTMKHYGGLRDWEFQHSIPVIRSKYRLIILPQLEFTYSVQKDSLYNVNINNRLNSGEVTFEMKNIPGLGDEPYMESKNDYVQKVIFQISRYQNQNSSTQKYMSSWEDVIRVLNEEEDFGKQLKKELSGTEAFILSLAAVTSEKEKMARVYDYVRKNMSWNGETRFFSTEGVKSAWNKKSAGSGSINLILINLLRDAKLEVYPMLVSERHHGKVNIKYPFVDQFNNVYACVIIDGISYYLDAIDRNTPPNLTPSDVLNTYALLMKKKSGGIIFIEELANGSRENINADAAISEDGRFSGKVFMTSRDYAKVSRITDYRENKDKYAENYLRKGFSDMSTDSLKIENDADDSLSLKTTFRFNLPLQNTGDYTFLKLNMFTGFETNPFLSENRFSDINFGFRQYLSLNTVVAMPEGYNVDEIPKAIQLVNEDKTMLFSRQVVFAKETRNLIVRIRIELKKSRYLVSEYPEIKDFYKKMFDLLNEPVVLKKKDN